MDGSPTVSKSVRRLAGDEQVDLAQALQRFVQGSYLEWPNEAGFEHLKEERGPLEISVSGHIAAWAAGSLFRTGPGQFDIENTSKGTFHTTHWFDGLAHTHRFDIVPSAHGSARVFYSSRRQSEELKKDIEKYGHRRYYSFGQKSDPCLGIFGKFMSCFHAVMHPVEERGQFDNCSVAVHLNVPEKQHEAVIVPIKDQDELEGLSKAGSSTVASPPAATGGHRPLPLPANVWVATDNQTIKKMDPETLEPVGFAIQHGLHPQLTGVLSCAHAHRDPITGDIYNFNLDFGRHACYRVFRMSASTGKVDILATVQQADIKPAYIHSFFLSSSYVILGIPSSHYALGGLKILWERNVMDAIQPFDAHNTCRWLVVDRLHGKGVVAHFETDACFFFHSVNAFEERDGVDKDQGTISLFCDVVEYPSLDIIHAFYTDVILNRKGEATTFWRDEMRARDTLPNLTRYHFRVPVQNSPSHGKSYVSIPNLPPAPGAKIFSIPNPHAGDLPTINPSLATSRHRYVYSLAHRGLSTVGDTLVKTDTETREALFWTNPHGHSPGEAIFVPRPGGTLEDDGVLLSLVLDGPSRMSYLLCLDARTMVETGRAEIGFAVALGFHGVHTSAAT